MKRIEDDGLFERWDNEDLDKLFEKWSHETKETKAQLAWVKDALRGEH